ncbi:MAG: hypothetical protein WBJ22_03040, partial [Minisyncoccales bacterium]
MVAGCARTQRILRILFNVSLRLAYSKKMRLLFNELTLFARDCFGLRPRNDSGGCCHRERGSETFKEDFIFFSTRNPLWRVRVTERGDPVARLQTYNRITFFLFSDF